MLGPSQQECSRYRKAAIIAVQSIVNAREWVTQEKLDLFSFALDKLPPLHALMVYGHTLLTLANRLDDEAPQKTQFEVLGQQVTRQMNGDYVDLLIADRSFYAEQHETLIRTFSRIISALTTATAGQKQTGAIRMLLLIKQSAIEKKEQLEGIADMHGRNGGSATGPKRPASFVIGEKLTVKAPLVTTITPAAEPPSYSYA